MLLTVCLTLLGTTVFWAMALCLACWRVSRHLKGNATATSAVVEHVVMPLFGHCSRAKIPGSAASVSENCEPVLRS